MMIILFVALVALGALLAIVEDHIWLDDEWEEKLSRVIPDLNRF